MVTSMDRTCQMFRQQYISKIDEQNQRIEYLEQSNKKQAKVIKVSPHFFITSELAFSPYICHV